MSFHVPDKQRYNANAMMATSSKDGNNGVFKIPLSGRSIAYCIASDGGGWEHVSVRVEVVVKAGGITQTQTPTWAQMCKIKDIFWDEDDCVVQYHPPKSDYINNHPNVLHLWKMSTMEFERPPSIMVGI